MSNKFSKQRLTIPRPKVCLSDQRPPPPPPPVTATCELSTSSIEIEGTGQEDIEVKGRNTDFPTGDFIAVTIVPDDNFTAEEQILNDDVFDSFTITAEVEEGTFDVQVEFTWDDLSTCLKPLHIVVIPEQEP